MKMASKRTPAELAQIHYGDLRKRNEARMAVAREAEGCKWPAREYNPTVRPV